MRPSVASDVTLQGSVVLFTYLHGATRGALSGHACLYDEGEQTPCAPSSPEQARVHPNYGLVWPHRNGLPYGCAEEPLVVLRHQPTRGEGGGRLSWAALHGDEARPRAKARARTSTVGLVGTHPAVVTMPSLLLLATLAGAAAITMARHPRGGVGGGGWVFMMVGTLWFLRSASGWALSHHRRPVASRSVNLSLRLVGRDRPPPGSSAQAPYKREGGEGVRDGRTLVMMDRGLTC